MTRILSAMRDEMTGQLLRYAAGQHICCPVCDTILDWHTTCIVGHAVTCESCFMVACDRVVQRRVGEYDTAENRVLVARDLLESLDLTSAHNWHVDDDGFISRGVQILSDD